MNILFAAKEDSKELAPLFDAYRQFYNQPSNLDGAEAYLSERLAEGESIIFFAKEGDEVLGFTQLYPTFSSISLRRAWILNDLYVSEQARKKGVGERLLQQVKEFAEETSAASVSLSTAPDNEKAQRLYERNGYVRDEEFLHYELKI
ncbi:GNAT family N-acetyltransferase [Jeotgalibacillus sp. R-1-5s-1]|uniref:GNAT family N-acetyltransferase n=1 Tax=Jeotgalibacillus sp. R-1-5s-1 TaxID=2555897 RepID=UPI00106B8E8F|nr:GNAT family N-acetyltransferase [Jeotgalibacillus sp. R-1-5s-1]TFD94541.1 GNAT family N-acetyltransferase [Jeotgalibacillus sp. R-1-5s-1]